MWLVCTDDDLLIRWRKLEQPFLALPPNHIQLTGWRDPFIYRTHSSSFGGLGDVRCERPCYGQW